MKERPIIFNGEMVRAVLEDRKTQTRRIMKPQPQLIGNTWVWPDDHPNDKMSWGEGSNPNVDAAASRHCPYGKHDKDRLWVRETHAFISPHEERCPIEECDIEYKADTGAAHPGGWDNEPDNPDAGRWRPSIHMPRWASRINLEVTAVRIERVQKISEENALAEGVELYNPKWEHGYYRDYLLRTMSPCDTARESFMTLWDSINDKRGYGWEKNPFVWVVEFRRVDACIWRREYE